MNRNLALSSGRRIRAFRSTLINRNITVAGHRTSIRLETAMWEALAQICEHEGRTPGQLVTEIERSRQESTLTAAIRVYLLQYYKAAASGGGYQRVSNG